MNISVGFLREGKHLMGFSVVQMVKNLPAHAWGWCMGMTQRDVIGREAGGGFMLGNTCIPVVDSCQCMAKPIQCCKVISFQLK